MFLGPCFDRYYHGFSLGLGCSGWGVGIWIRNSYLGDILRRYTPDTYSLFAVSLSQGWGIGCFGHGGCSVSSLIFTTPDIGSECIPAPWFLPSAIGAFYLGPTAFVAHSCLRRLANFFAVLF